MPITIKVKGDLLDEVDETLKLELLNATTDAVVRTATGTIRNDDNNSKLSIGDASSDEPGNADVPGHALAGERARGQGQLGDRGRHRAAGSDYTGGGGTLTFAPGETTKTSTWPSSGTPPPRRTRR